MILFYLRWLSFINKLKINVRSLLGLDLNITEITGKFVATVKKINCKVYVKKSPTLLNIYYFITFFQEIVLGLIQFVVAVYKNWHYKYNTFKNKIMDLGASSRSYFLFESKVRKRKTFWEKTQSHLPHVLQ